MSGKPPSKRGPRPGDRAPYGVIEAGTDGGPRSVFDLTGGTGHDLLLFEGSEVDPALDAYRLALREVLGRYAVETNLHTVSAEERELLELYAAKEEARLFLIRPDGHVAFVGLLGDLGDLVEHMDALFHERTASEGRHPERSANLSREDAEGTSPAGRHEHAR